MTNIARRKLGEEISVEQVVVAQALGCWRGKDWVVVYPGDSRVEGNNYWLHYDHRFSADELETFKSDCGAKFYLLSPAVEEVLDED